MHTRILLSCLSGCGLGRCSNLGDAVHWSGFCSFILGKFCFCLWFLLLLFVRPPSLHDCRFRLDSDGPDEAQQTRAHGGDDLCAILAWPRASAYIAYAAMLCLPRNLLISSICLWSLAQRRSHAGPQPIASRPLPTAMRRKCACPVLVMLPRWVRLRLESSLGTHRLAQSVAVLLQNARCCPNSAAIVTAKSERCRRSACQAP